MRVEKLQKENLATFSTKQAITHQQGFTLIELVVVVIIIGILAAIAMPRYGQVVEKARMTEAVNVLGSLRQAQLRYSLQYGDYTSTMTNLDINATSGAEFGNKYFAFQVVTSPDPAPNDGVNQAIAQATRNSAQCCGGYASGYTVQSYEGGNITTSAGGPPPP